MKLQSKITLTLLAVSLIATVTVGLVAYGFLMWDFRQSVKDRAFSNFTGDITVYLNRYGTLKNGERQEPFDQFVFRRHAPPTLPEGEFPLRPKVPPFRFMVLDPEGRVMNKDGEFGAGRKVPDTVFQQSRPIEVDGRVAVRVVQIGEPVLTYQDRQYLKVIRNALVTGILAAGGLAVLLGLFLGRRLSLTLRELTQAIGSMSLDGELSEEVPVRSEDEIGLLTETFNRMSGSLARTHAELRESHDKIQAQALDLHELSIRDPLTNLFNRRHFDAQAEILFNQSIRYGRPFTIMLGDLDHFKKINDRLSHAVGDEVLRQVSALITANVRKSDIVARYGGEEFVIAFPESDLQRAARSCEKLRKFVENHPWGEIHPDLKVTISMGLCDNADLGSVEKMLNEADEHLYEAKNQGRNRLMPPILQAI